MVLPVMIRVAALANGIPVALNERDRAGCAGICFDDVEDLGDECELDVDESADSTPFAIASVELPDAVDHGLAQGERRQDTSRVTGVNPGFLDVLHDSAEEKLGAVVEGIDVDLDRVIQELVDGAVQALRVASLPSWSRRDR